MSALVTRFFPKASTEAIAELDTLVSIGIFCSIGLLISVTTLVLDKYIPGEWF